MKLCCVIPAAAAMAILSGCVPWWQSGPEPVGGVVTPAPVGQKTYSGAGAVERMTASLLMELTMSGRTKSMLKTPFAGTPAARLAARVYNALILDGIATFNGPCAGELDSSIVDGVWTLRLFRDGQCVWADSLRLNASAFENGAVRD